MAGITGCSCVLWPGSVQKPPKSIRRRAGLQRRNDSLRLGMGTTVRESCHLCCSSGRPRLVQNPPKSDSSSRKQSWHKYGFTDGCHAFRSRWRSKLVQNSPVARHLTKGNPPSVDVSAVAYTTAEKDRRLHKILPQKAQESDPS